MSGMQDHNPRSSLYHWPKPITEDLTNASSCIVISLMWIPSMHKQNVCASVVIYSTFGWNYNGMAKWLNYWVASSLLGNDLRVRTIAQPQVCRLSFCYEMEAASGTLGKSPEVSAILYGVTSLVPTGRGVPLHVFFPDMLCWTHRSFRTRCVRGLCMYSMRSKHYTVMMNVQGNALECTGVFENGWELVGVLRNAE